MNIFNFFKSKKNNVSVKNTETVYNSFNKLSTIYWDVNASKDVIEKTGFIPFDGPIQDITIEDLHGVPQINSYISFVYPIYKDNVKSYIYVTAIINSVEYVFAAKCKYLYVKTTVTKVCEENSNILYEI